MKHLTTLLLTLLVLGGCSMRITDPLLDEVEGLDDEWELYVPRNYDPIIGKRVKIQAKDNIGFKWSKLYYKKSDDLYSVDFIAGGKVLLFSLTNRYPYEPNICSQFFGTETKLGPDLAKEKFNNRFPITQSRKFTYTCYKEGEYVLVTQELERLAKQRILEEKLSKCREYGFKDDTDGMGLCLIELDKLAKLEEQILAIEKRNNQVYLQNQQLIADQQRQREAQALINLGAAISGAGMPRTNTPKAPSTTYPNSFSSSLTIPSNQVCPILSTPITKQEIRGANRICYYQ